MLTIFLWSNAWFSCIDGVAGIMPIITCPSCNLTNPRFCRKTGLVANTCLFGFIWCRLLRRHLGFDSDFAQISGLKIGGWHLWHIAARELHQITPRHCWKGKYLLVPSLPQVSASLLLDSCDTFHVQQCFASS